MTVEILPSLICLDLCRLEEEVRALEALGLGALHVDLLDGAFSPSLPIGLEVVRQLRQRTGMLFDAHVMARDNDFFVGELLDIGVQRLCFQVETALHADRLLTRIAGSGAEAGVALAPGTPLNVLEYLVERVDFVLLMLINPGFAGHAGESRVPYARRKVAECRAFLDRRRPGIRLAVDGRVGFEIIPELVRAGADRLVAGSACLFDRADSRENNLRKIAAAVKEGSE